MGRQRRLSVPESPQVPVASFPRTTSYVTTSVRRYVATSLTCITPGRVARAVRLRNQLPDTAYGPFSSNTCHFTDEATVTKELKT